MFPTKRENQVHKTDINRYRLLGRRRAVDIHVTCLPLCARVNWSEYTELKEEL